MRLEILKSIGLLARFLALVGCSLTTGCTMLAHHYCGLPVSLGRPVTMRTASFLRGPNCLPPWCSDGVECEPFCCFTLRQWPWGEWPVIDCSYCCSGTTIQTLSAPPREGEKSQGSPHPPLPPTQESQPLPAPPAKSPSESDKADAGIALTAHSGEARPTQVSRVEGSSRVTLKVLDLTDPVPVGTWFDYVIQVTNQDRLPAYDLQVCIEYPEELNPVRFVHGPDMALDSLQTRRIEVPAFDLAPFGTRLLRLRMTAQRRSDVQLRVTLSGPDLPQAIVQEESTRLFGGR